MKSLRRLLARLFNVITHRIARDQDARLREEIADHIALQTEENLRAGLSPIEARRQAMVKFGGIEAVKQDYRAERGFLFFDHLARDLRFAFRMLRKSPGFTCVALLTLALAIGANAVVFSALNDCILRPLNVPQPESFYGMQFCEANHNAQSYPNFQDFRDRNRTLDGLAAYDMDQVGVDTGDNSSRAWLYEVSGNYFDVLRIRPYLGIFFHSPDEHGAGSAPYIVLSYGYWHARFQDDAGVVGRTVKLNERPFTIIGVAPPEFKGTFLLLSPDFFVPMVSREDAGTFDSRSGRWIFELVGHLKPGVTREQAAAGLNSICGYLHET